MHAGVSRHVEVEILVCHGIHYHLASPCRQDSLSDGEESDFAVDRLEGQEHRNPQRIEMVYERAVGAIDVLDSYQYDWEILRLDLMGDRHQ